MAGNKFKIDFSEVTQFLDKMKQAASGDFKRELSLLLEDIGLNLLSIIENEIVRHKSVDTRKLLDSFKKGGDGNVWEMTDGGLTLEVGTNVKYARLVNDGHFANPPGVEMRFIPGSWVGDRFVYQPGAKTGMVLKQQWVEGKHYLESAVNILEKMMPGTLDEMIQQWLDQYFM